MLYILYITFIVISFILVLKYKKIGILKNNFNIIFLCVSFLISGLTIFGITSIKTNSNQFRSSNVAFLLDVSKSMKVEDIEENNNFYSRIYSAKKIIEKFVSQNEYNKYSLTIFTKESLRILPFTTDQELFLTILDSCDENNISSQGTDLIEAIKGGIKNFVGDDNNGNLIIITDGSDEKIGDLSQIKENLKNKNINIIIIGIGSQKGGNIPVGKDPFGREIYKSYQGNYVISKLNEDSLVKITNELNGTYLRFENISNIKEIEKILNKSFEKIETKNNIYKTTINREIIIVSFIFWLFYLLILVKGRKK